MSGIYYVIGAGDISGAALDFSNSEFVIAADAGLKYLEPLGIKPDLIVGDFDSLGEIPKGENVISHSPEKDETDMYLAVSEALKRGAKTLVIYGGLGGRLDHELANLQTLAYIAERGAQGYLVGRGCVASCVKDGGIEFDASMEGTVSVLCHGDRAEGVNLIGLKYPLTDYTLTCDYPLGVSNEFTGAPATISVKKGLLTVIWNGSAFEPKKYRAI